MPRKLPETTKIHSEIPGQSSRGVSRMEKYLSKVPAHASRLVKKFEFLRLKSFFTVAGIDECSYWEVGVGPLGSWITAKRVERETRDNTMLSLCMNQFCFHIISRTCILGRVVSARKHEGSSSSNENYEDRSRGCNFEKFPRTTRRLFLTLNRVVLGQIWQHCRLFSDQSRGFRTEDLFTNENPISYAACQTTSQRVSA